MPGELVKIIYNLLGIFANQTARHLWFLWTSIPISHLLVFLIVKVLVGTFNKEKAPVPGTVNFAKVH